MPIDIVGDSYDISGDDSVSGGLRVVNRRENRVRRYALPMPTSGAIAAAGTVTVIATPQLKFRVERLFTPASATFLGLLITDIRVGQDSQFVSPGEIDVTLFAPTSFGIELKGATAVPGIQVSMSLLNSTAGALTLRGCAIVGTALE